MNIRRLCGLAPSQKESSRRRPQANRKAAQHSADDHVDITSALEGPESNALRRGSILRRPNTQTPGGDRIDALPKRRKTVQFASYARVFPSDTIKRIAPPQSYIVLPPKSISEVYERVLTYNQSQWVAFNMPQLCWEKRAECAFLENAPYPQF